MAERTCRSCVSEIDHCHGTLMLHAGRIAECTDSGCVDADFARHTFTVECTDVAGGCRCDEQWRDDRELRSA
ncbi:hypothetical protein B0T44_22530 [Nocardia donostiensis]|uniref:Uncharacterized protein n=1 Tax=Nocardia donostiensis TaxID=1538463 RepID=A0A1V2TD73_9NOCA|nr:hypothetical protein B0T46_18050 [Nocardia donostiensis]OQS14310.1 hypothetical protein B0T36_14995 [Nocardia donostiensis]OQS17861.1 hypothetical protein B0T44_22530 [Nocardia donostiensis]